MMWEFGAVRSVFPLLLAQTLLVGLSWGQTDTCSYCEANPTSCRQISGIFMVTVLSKGTYNPVVEIPASACKINITELRPSTNYLAVRSRAGKGIINSYWAVGPPGSFQGAGTRFRYDRKAGPSCPGECIQGRGPLNETIVVQLLYYQKNPGISFTFTLPNNVPFTPYEGTSAQQPQLPHRQRHHHAHQRRQYLKRLLARRRGHQAAATREDTRPEGPETPNEPSLVRPTSWRPTPTSFARETSYSGRNEGSSFEGRGQSGSYGGVGGFDQGSERQDSFGSRGEHRASHITRDRQELRGTSAVLPATAFTGDRGYVIPRRQDAQRAQQRGLASDNSVRPDYSNQRTYGSHTLGGRGLSYSLSYPIGDNKQTPVQLAQRPRYLTPREESSDRGRYGYSALTAGGSSSSYLPEEGHAPNSARGAGSSSYTPARESGLGRDRGADNQYMWRISGLTECSHSCGGGTQETNVVCVLRNTQALVTPENCDGKVKPFVQQVSCNTNPCSPAWETEEWSQCSVTCGSGTQTRRVECRQRFSPTLDISVSASLCDVTTKPAVAQQCEEEICAQWYTSPWSNCSVQCGQGERTRTVECQDAGGVQIPDKYCPAPAPPGKEQCDMGTCERQWWMSDWSNQCTSECGAGVRTRDVLCASKEGARLPDYLCPQADQPSSQASCRSDTACGNQWFTGPWGKCSAECGSGVKKRAVMCMKPVGNTFTLAYDRDCKADSRPADEETCNSAACGSQWYMTEWSKCSVTCGNGYKTREVRCLDPSRRPSTSCPHAGRPARREECQLQECPRFQATSTDADCQDKFKNCRVVVQARLCPYPFYKDICCGSCRHAS